MRSAPVLPVAVLALATVALAGCLGSSTEGLEGAGGAPAGLTGLGGALPRAPEPFAYLLCAGDRLDALAMPRDSTDCNPRATHDSGPAAEVSLAVNPLDPRNLVGGSKDFTLGEDERCGRYNVWSGAYASFDGGRTWSHQLLPGHPGDGRETPLSAYACGSDPVLAFGPDGIVYYVGIYYAEDPDADGPPLAQLGPLWGVGPLNAGLAVTRSLDGGATWEEPVLLGHREDGGLWDKEWLAVDMATGQVYVTAIMFPEGEFVVYRSDDQGRTWTEPVAIVPWGDGMSAPDGGQFMQVAVDPSSTVHVTYWATGTDPRLEAVWHRSSRDGGATWSEAHRVATFTPIFDLEFTHKYRIVPNPALAVSAVDEALYVSYPFLVTPGTLGDGTAGWLEVYVARSLDGGRTWEPAVRVNDELVAPLNGQWMQAIAVGPDGRVHLAWLDYRDDPTGQRAHVYHAHSSDRGATWSRNARVSDVPFDGTGGYHQSGSGTIGDYLGLAVSPAAAHPFWADTRDGRNDVFAAILPS